MQEVFPPVPLWLGVEEYSPLALLHASIFKIEAITTGRGQLSIYLVA
jgi:hypothetical protein